MPFEPELSRTQRWMQAVILHPGSALQALSSDEAKREIPARRFPEVVAPSRALTSTERIGIYRDMYLLRLREALRADYPLLLRFLGEERFHALADDYVHTHPSRSYTLNRLGDHLPEFIRTQAKVARRGFLYDLARLELAMTEAFDAEEAAVLSPLEVESLPEEAWETMRLKPVPALRLLEFSYPVNDYAQAVRDETPAPPLRKRITYAAVCRKDYGAVRLELPRAAFLLLQALAAGTPVGEAIDNPALRQVKESDLFGWFSQWVAAGMFRSIA
ncbi:MAG: putative DNA-binding domain-containing protein [Bryobacterales bacterium]|nr:putative DNA-binding domain-containing protein [Bryobacterales bacterium]